MAVSLVQISMNRTDRTARNRNFCKKSGCLCRRLSEGFLGSAVVRVRIGEIGTYSTKGGLEEPLQVKGTISGGGMEAVGDPVYLCEGGS